MFRRLTAATVMALTISAAAHAGCDLTTTLRNDANGTLEIYQAQVKIKNGIWKNLSNFGSSSFQDSLGNFIRGYVVSDLRGVDIPPGQSLKLSHSSPFKCDNSRRFKVEFKCGNGKVLTREYPGPDSFTANRNNTIGLGASCS